MTYKKYGIIRYKEKERFKGVAIFYEEKILKEIVNKA